MIRLEEFIESCDAAIEVATAEIDLVLPKLAPNTVTILESWN